MGAGVTVGVTEPGGGYIKSTRHIFTGLIFIEVNEVVKRNLPTNPSGHLTW